MTTKHTIRLRTEDGETFSFECADDENVVSAGFRNNVILMSECHKGICTTCRALCTEGEFELGEGVNVYSLPPEDQEEGFTLLCQTYPTTDLEIELPYDSDRVTFGSVEFERSLSTSVVTAKRWTDNVMSLVLQIDAEDAEKFTYQAGQYVNLKVPGKDEWRSFSMANCPGAATTNDDERGRVELMIRLLEQGIFSDYLRDQANTGDRIEIRGPFGNFVIRRSEGRPRYFVAGSTGLAPLVSMLRDLRRKGDQTPCKLIFGMRSKEYLFYHNELENLAQEMPSLDLHVALEALHDGWNGRRGTVAEAFETILDETGEEPDVYVCGPAGMVERIDQICRDRQIPRERVFTEKFQASG